MIVFGWNNLMIQSIYLCSITTKVIPIGVYWGEKSYLLAGPLTVILSWKLKWPPVKREIFFSDMESFSGSTWVNICEGKTTLFRTIFRDLRDLVRFSPTRFWQNVGDTLCNYLTPCFGNQSIYNPERKRSWKSTHLHGDPSLLGCRFFKGFFRC